MAMDKAAADLPSLAGVAEETARRLADLIQAKTRLLRPPLTPELRFHGADALTDLWSATEATLEADGLAPPYWAFAWPGGQVLARYLLDTPEAVRGAKVAALASGGGLEAIAAALAGAASVSAFDIDPAAAVAAWMNAQLNQVDVDPVVQDLFGPEGVAAIEAADVVLAADAYYERGLAERLDVLLSAAAARGALVLVGGPVRGFSPQGGFETLMTHDIPVDETVEDVSMRSASVRRLRPVAG